MTGTHDANLVILSILVAVLASFTALNLAARVRAASGRAARIWLGAAAIALGGGIWSMHFVAMLAFTMPGMTIGHELAPTLVSLALAIGFTGLGLGLLDWQRPTLSRIGLAGLLIGAGVVAMHYVGMAGMRMPGMSFRYDPAWVLLSVLIALAASVTAVWLASRDQQLGHQLVAAAVMGAAISGMHYSGIAAARFASAAPANDVAGMASIDQTFLAIAISGVTVAILLLSLGAAHVQRIMEQGAAEQARIALRLAIADVLRGRDTEAGLSAIAAMMGEHFGASRVGFGDLDPAEDMFDYRVCWTDDTVPPLLGRFPAAAFGVKIVAALTAGRTVAIDDLFASALSDEVRTRDTAREVDTRAILVVPFVRDGRLRTIVYLNARDPRRWQPDEIGFMEEVAERVRLVIERQAAEDQLRELNASLEVRVEARTRELQLAEDRRRQADALYRAYFEHTPDPLFVIGVRADGAFIVEQINPAHEAGVGFRLAEIEGRAVDAFLPPEAAERVVAAYRHVVDTRDIYRYREIFQLHGAPQYWDTTLVPLIDADGRVVRIIGSSRDVTRQVSAEEALRQAQKMEAMGQLTGGVAHDFNNLLTPILGALDRLHGKGVGDERDRRLIAGALQSSERARTLVHRLLSFARRQPLKPVPINPAELISGMADLIASTVGPQIRLVIDAPPGLPAAVADPNQLEMALLNLSVNARDAMPEGGVLTVSAASVTVAADEVSDLQAGPYVQLCVADTGTGMDEATLKRAVEPFFSTKGVGRGTGLGLSMAHGLASQLGGTLTIKSAPGEGTTICLWLPEGEAAPPVGTASGTASVDRQSGRVLLVDDEELVRETTAQMLRDLGYTVTAVNGADAAMARLREGPPPDLLVTDHLMPGTTGNDLARWCAAHVPTVKMLVVSGYADVGGIDAHLSRLTKPFLKEELGAAINGVLGQAPVD